jgi:hypothetical protein
MTKRYKLEFEVLIDEEAEAQLIDSARRLYRQAGGVTETQQNGSSRQIPATEYIDGTTAALLQLVESNSLLQDFGASYENLTSTELGVEAGEQPQEEVVEEVSADQEGGIDTNAFETGVYLYRWPNGGFSIVKAENRNDAVFMLDEFEAADPMSLEPMENCMIDFILDDAGEIGVTQFGDETREFIWETCYPELNQLFLSNTLATTPSGEYTEAAMAAIAKGVEHERTRMAPQ